MKNFNFKFPDLKGIGNNLSDRIKSIGKSEGEHGRKLTPKQKSWKFFKYFLGIIASLAIVGIIAGGLLFAYYASSAPSLSERQLVATNSSILYDKNGSEIADLGAEKRISAKTDSIPVNLVNAITAIEDHRFYKHRGIDIYRIIGAAWHNMTRTSTQGGSTLDQQLIKLAYFSTNNSDKTLKRKAQEAWLSIQMEKKYSKEEIMTFYVNKVYMGNGYYGMQTAAKGYYGKSLTDLSIPQLALLAGLPNAPTLYDPYTNPEQSKKRRDTVLSEMYKVGSIDKKTYDSAIATDVGDGLIPQTEKSSYDAYLDNYIKEVVNQVSAKTHADVYSAGLKVYTNVDPTAQQRLYDIVNSDDYVAYPDDQMQIATTVIDVTNGNVVAQIGARHQDAAVSMGSNQAVLTDRDWGSTMKPITDYAPAIENGVYNSTGASVSDSPYNFPGTSTPVYDWDRKYMGTMSIQTAIQQSRNIPAVKSLYSVGLDKAQAFLSGLGINYPELQYSNAISSNTSSADQKYGASSEKMAAAYAAFANGGTYYEPLYINKIEFSNGKDQTFSSNGSQAMSPETAYMMVDMMKTVLQAGTGTKAAVPGAINAGKTGTSNYSDDELAQVEANTGLYNASVGTMAPDESFVGITPMYSMAVWTGYKSRFTPVYGTGLDVAAEVYQAMSSFLFQTYGSGSTDWTMPDGVYRSGGYVAKSGYSNNYSYSTSSSSYSYSSSSDTQTQSSSSSSDDNSSSSSSQTNQNNDDSEDNDSE
ncbi:penicillin-binding protein PBP1A [Streptococcus tangpeifui]|uniref:penicillin-binding protein PBP1A n=1 Tax=Streptococcus tangpeifui TaxID=2709400 RepID=UPI0013EAC29B|nr:penicillin-binding protein PBP1A [Streptococcus sp. ZJ373]